MQDCYNSSQTGFSKCSQRIVVGNERQIAQKVVGQQNDPESHK